MGKPIIYKLGIDLENKDALKKLADLKTAINETEDGKILVDLSFNENRKDLQKKIKALADSNPQLGIQFQYDINKRALLQAKDELTDLETIQMNIDTKGAKGYINELKKEISTLFKSGASKDVITSKVQNLLNITNSIDPSLLSETERNIKKVFDSIKGLRELKPQTIFDLSKLESAREEVNYFEEVCNKLKKEGAIDIVDNASNKEIAELSERVSMLEDKITSINEKMKNMSGEEYEQAAHSVEILNESLNNVLEAIEKINSTKVSPDIETDGETEKDLKSRAERIANELKNIVNSLRDGKLIDEYKELGNDVGEAYASGIEEKIERAKEANEKLVKESFDAAKKEIAKNTDSTKAQKKNANDSNNIDLKEISDKKKVLQEQRSALESELDLQNRLIQIENKKVSVRRKKNETDEELNNRQVEAQKAKVRELGDSFKEEINLYVKLSKEYKAAEDGSNAKNQARYKLIEQMVVIQNKINELRSYENEATRKDKLAADFIKTPGNDKFTLSKLYQQFDEQLSQFNDMTEKRVNEINTELAKLGDVSKTARKAINKNEASTEEQLLSKILGTEKTKNTKGNKVQLTLPIRVQEKALENLQVEVNAIIDELNKNIKPLEVQVALVSKKKTAKQTELQEQLEEQLKDIDDEEVKKRISTLLTNLEKQIGNKLHIDVEVAGGEKARTAVRKILKDLVAELKNPDTGKSIFPPLKIEGEFSKETIDNLSKQLNEIDFEPIKINVKKVAKGKDGKDGKSLEKEYTPLEIIKRAIINITTAINEKTDAFTNEVETVREGAIEEEQYLKPVLDAFLGIRDVLSEIQSLSGTLGDIHFNIDAENLSKLVGAASVISNNISNTALSSSTQQKGKTNTNSQISDQKGINAELENQINNSKKATDSIEKQSKEVQELYKEFVKLRSAAIEYEAIVNEFGEGFPDAISEGEKIGNILANLESKYQNIIRKDFNDIANMSDSDLLAKAKGILGTTSKQSEEIKEVKKQTLETKTAVEKMDEPLQKTSKNAKSFAESMKKAEKSSQAIYTTLGDKKIINPLTQNAYNGLFRMFNNTRVDRYNEMDKDEYKEWYRHNSGQGNAPNFEDIYKQHLEELSKASINKKAATDILKMVNDYVQSGSKNILEQIKTYTASSSLSSTMKKSISGSIDRLIKSLGKQIETTGKTAVKESVTPQKMKTITMGKGDYKDWYKANSGFGDSSDFDYNFEKHLENLVKAGKAKQDVSKKGRKGKWHIQVQVEDTGTEQVQQNLDKIEKKEEKIAQKSVENSKRKTEAKQKEVKAVQEKVKVVEKEEKVVQRVSNKIKQDNTQKSETDLEKGFNTIKNNLAKHGNYNLSKKDDKQSLAYNVGKYISYQKLGGTRPITDLTDNQKALAKITAEYEKQIEAKKTIFIKEKETQKLSGKKQTAVDIRQLEKQAKAKTQITKEDQKQVEANQKIADAIAKINQIELNSKQKFNTIANKANEKEIFTQGDILGKYKKEYYDYQNKLQEQYLNGLVEEKDIVNLLKSKYQEYVQATEKAIEEAKENSAKGIKVDKEKVETIKEETKETNNLVKTNEELTESKKEAQKVDILAKAKQKMTKSAKALKQQETEITQETKDYSSTLSSLTDRFINEGYDPKKLQDIHAEIKNIQEEIGITNEHFTEFADLAMHVKDTLNKMGFGLIGNKWQEMPELKEKAKSGTIEQETSQINQLSQELNQLEKEFLESGVDAQKLGELLGKVDDLIEKLAEANTGGLGNKAIDAMITQAEILNQQLEIAHGNLTINENSISSELTRSVQEQNNLQKELKETEQQAKKASTAIKEIRVWLKDENTDAIINELVPSKYANLVNGKVFQNRNDMQNTMMALSRGSKFALEHGLATPKDLTDAIKKIEALEDYNQLLEKKNQLEKQSNKTPDLSKSIPDFKNFEELKDYLDKLDLAKLKEEELFELSNKSHAIPFSPDDKDNFKDYLNTLDIINKEIHKRGYEPDNPLAGTWKKSEQIVDSLKEEEKQAKATAEAEKNLTNVRDKRDKGGRPDASKYSQEEINKISQENEANIVRQKYAEKTEEELKECLATEEKWLKKCKEGSEAYNRRKSNIEAISSLLKAQTQQDQSNTSNKRNPSDLSKYFNDNNISYEKFSDDNLNKAFSDKFVQLRQKYTDGLIDEKQAAKELGEEYDRLKQKQDNVSKNVTKLAKQVKEGIQEANERIYSSLGEFTRTGVPRELNEILADIDTVNEHIEIAKKKGRNIASNNASKYLKRRSDIKNGKDIDEAMKSTYMDFASQRTNNFWIGHEEDTLALLKEELKTRLEISKVKKPEEYEDYINAEKIKERNNKILQAISLSNHDKDKKGVIEFSSLEDETKLTDEYSEALNRLGYQIEKIYSVRPGSRFANPESRISIIPINDKAVTDLNKAKEILQNIGLDNVAKYTEKNVQAREELAQATEKAAQKDKELAQSEQMSTDRLEAGFQIIKKKVAEFGNFNLSKTKDKEGLSHWVDQYIKYQNQGGTRPIEDLTDNTKALNKIKKEYSSQTTVVSKDTVDGLTEGIKEKEQQYFDTMEELMEEGIRVARRTIEAESPAKKYIQVSIDAVEGLIEGLKQRGPKYLAYIKALMESGVEEAKKVVKDWETVFTNPSTSNSGASNKSSSTKSSTNNSKKSKVDPAIAAKEKAVKALDSQIEKTAKGLQRLIDSEKYTDNANSLFSSYIDDLLKLQGALKNTDIDSVREEFNLLASNIAQDTRKSSLNSYLKESELAISKFGNKLAEFEENNSNLGINLSKRLKEIKDRYENLVKSGKSGNALREELKSLDTLLNRLSADAKNTGQAGDSFGKKIVKSLSSANAQLIATYFSFRDLIRYARTAFESVRQLDTALVDLKKTTTMTNADLEEFYQNASNIAKETGVTTQEIISQAAAWSRLGYSSKEAAENMAKLSSQFAKISPGTSVEDATDYLVSTMKAFDIDVLNVESEIMDAVNRIGNTMATSNQEVGEMLKRSSAAMAAANNSLAETIALESAAVQITRNAEQTGTAFRTISMRIRGYDEETEELSEDLANISGVIADLTKTASKPNGISLFTDATKTTYKSTYDLLKEISGIYHDLTDKQQAAVLEKLGGKRGGQVLAGILNDFSEVERAMSEIEKSAGSADAEMSIIEESWDYKLNALKETWVNTFQSLIDRGAMGQLIDFLTQISELLGKIANISGLEGAVALIANIGTQSFLKKNLSINLADLITFDNAKDVVTSLSNTWKNIVEAIKIDIEKVPVGLSLPDKTQQDYWGKITQYNKQNEIEARTKAEIEAMNASDLAKSMDKKMDEVSIIMANQRGKHGQFLTSPNNTILDFTKNQELDYKTIEDRLTRIRQNANATSEDYTKLMVDIVGGINDCSTSAEEFGFKVKDAAEYFRGMAGDDFSDQLIRIGEQNPFVGIEDNAHSIISEIAEEAENTANNVSSSVEDTIITMFEDMGDSVDEIPDLSGEQVDFTEEWADKIYELQQAQEAETIASQSNTITTQQNTIAHDANTLSKEKDTSATIAQVTASKARLLALAQEILAMKGYSVEEQNIILRKISELGITEQSTVAEIKEAAARISNTDAISMETKAILNQIAAQKQQSSIGYKLKGLLVGGIKQIAIQLAFMALTKAVSWSIEKIDEYIHKEERLAEKAKQSAMAINDATKSLNTNKKSVDDIKDKYASLAQGVYGLGTAFQSQGKLPLKDYEEFLDLSDQLADMFPTLIKGYDDNGHAILDLSGNINTIVGSLDNLITRQAQLTRSTIDKEMPEIWDNNENKLVDINTQLDQYNSYLSEYEKINELYKKSSSGQPIWEEELDGSTIKQLELALDAIGVKYEDLISTVVDGQGGQERDLYLNRMLDSQKILFEDYIASTIDEYTKLTDQVNSQLEQINAEMISNLNAYLSGDVEYLKLNDIQKNFVSEILGNFDMSHLPKDVDEWSELTKWYHDNIIMAISKINNEDVLNAIQNIFSGELTLKESDNAFKQILDYLTKDLGLKPGDDGYELVIQIKSDWSDLNNSREDLVKKLFSDFVDDPNDAMGRKLEAAIQKYGHMFDDLTSSDIQALLNSPIDLSDIYNNEEEVVKRVHDYLAGQVAKQEPISLTDWLNDSSFEKDDKGNNKTRQDLINDYYSFLSNIASIRDQIDNGDEITIGDLLGEYPDLQPYIDKYDDFSEAIDKYILDKYDELKEKNGDYSNIAGAAEFWTKVVDETNKALNNKTLTPLFDSQATVNDAVQTYEQNTELWLNGLASSYAKLFEDKKFNYKAVDKDTIASIKKDFKNLENSLHINVPDEEMDKFVKIITNSKTTTEQAQQAFDDYATALFNAANGLKDINEENAEYMKKLFKDNGLDADKAIDEYIKYQNDLKKATAEQNVLYEQNKEAKLKVVEIENQLTHARDEERQALEIEKAGIEQEITLREKEMASHQAAAIELTRLQAIEAGIDLNHINTISDVEQILNIARACGVASESLLGLETLIAGRKKVEAYKNSYAYTIDVQNLGAEGAQKKLDKMINDYTRQAQDEVTELLSQEKNEVHVGITTPTSADKDAAGSAGKDAADAYMDAYNKELSALDFLYKNGYYTEKEYLDAKKALYEKYFKDVEGYQKEYFEAEREYYEQLIALQQKAINAAIRILERQIKEQERLRDAEKKEYEEQKKINEKKIKEIEKLNKKIDKQIKLLQKEQKTIRKQNIEPLEDQIKSRQKVIDELNSEIELMERANDARQDEINLQKMAYELERSKHQRHQLVNIYANPCSNAWI